MAVQVQTLYNEVVKVFLEDNGFATGVLTDDQFFKALQDALDDFLSRVGCSKKIINVQVLTGTSQYPEPDMSIQVESASASQSFLFRDSGAYLDFQDTSWSQGTGQPFKWKEDELAPKTIQITPIPVVDGYDVTVVVGNDGYGVVSSTSNVNDFDIVADLGQQGYGTISAAPGGAVYLESLNLGYGTISTMVSSTGNLQMISSVTTYSDSTKLIQYLEFIPDSFTLYLKYGVLEKLFSQDSEAKDLQRAMYCRMRYKEGVALVSSVMDTVGFGDGE